MTYLFSCLNHFHQSINNSPNINSSPNITFSPVINNSPSFENMINLMTSLPHMKKKYLKLRLKLVKEERRLAKKRLKLVKEERKLHRELKKLKAEYEQAHYDSNHNTEKIMEMLEEIEDRTAEEQKQRLEVIKVSWLYERS